MIINQYKWGTFKHKQKKNKIQIYDILDSIQQSNVKSVEMENLLDPKITSHLTHIKFQRLSYLWLGGNLIENIQFLNFIDIPSLRQLGLNCNYITNIKTLIKIGCSKNNFIDLQYNQIKTQNFQSANRINFNKSGQIYTNNQSLIQKKQLNFLEDNSYMFKLQINIFTTCWYEYKGIQKKLIDKNKSQIAAIKQIRQNQ